MVKSLSRFRILINFEKKCDCRISHVTIIIDFKQGSTYCSVIIDLSIFDSVPVSGTTGRRPIGIGSWIPRPIFENIFDLFSLSYHGQYSLNNAFK